MSDGRAPGLLPHASPSDDLRPLPRRHSVADRRCQMSKGALTPPDQLPRRPMPDAGVF
jgi:hypothetical protein